MLSKLNIIHKNILFQFVEEATQGQRGFTNSTAWGFVVNTHQDNASLPRWGKVVKVGPEVNEHITEGSYILIEPLMWTANMSLNDEKYWSTNTDKIIAYQQEEPQGIY